MPEQITHQQFDAATRRGKARRDSQSLAIEACYDARRGRIVIHFRNGLELSVDPLRIQGLAEARPAELREIHVSPSGMGLHFPSLDADIYIPGLLAGAFGSRKWMAAQLGAAGGESRTTRKKKAARANGKLGGRPRKTVAS